MSERLKTVVRYNVNKIVSPIIPGPLVPTIGWICKSKTDLLTEIFSGEREVGAGGSLQGLEWRWGQVIKTSLTLSTSTLTAG